MDGLVQCREAQKRKTRNRIVWEEATEDLIRGYMLACLLLTADAILQ